VPGTCKQVSPSSASFSSQCAHSHTLPLQPVYCDLAQSIREYDQHRPRSHLLLSKARIRPRTCTLLKARNTVTATRHLRLERLTSAPWPRRPHIYHPPSDSNLLYLRFSDRDHEIEWMDKPAFERRAVMRKHSRWHTARSEQRRVHQASCKHNRA
jgi:hypothetical protein